MAKKQKKEAQSIDKSNEKLCAILSYLFIGIIWYFVDEKMKKSEFVKYHTKQGLALLITAIAYNIIIGILLFPLIIISLGLLAPLLALLYYVPLIWIIIGIVNAANNKMKPLPIIGKFANNFSF